MIVGNGMIANALKKIDKDDVVFFCSGVSNSNEQNEEEFIREKASLIAFANSDKKLIYFSSYFVNFENYLTKRYYQHKSEIEQIIQNSFERFIIYRLPQIVGKSSNPNTLTNFIADKIEKNEILPVYKKAKRNIIDIDDVALIIDYSNQHNLFCNQVVNLISPKSYNIDEIINVFESVMKIKANKKYLTSNEIEFDILLTNEMEKLFIMLQINFDELYLENLINKYYRRN